MLPYVILGATYAFAAAVQPGQLNAYLISQALANGWRPTLPAVVAPLISDLPIIVLVLVILTRVPTLFLHLLQLAGGLFVLYLAAGAARAWRDDRRSDPRPSASARQTVVKATFVNILNPSPYLGWSLVMGPLLLKAWRQSPSSGVALVVAFYLAMVLTSAGIVMLFAGARSFGPRVARALVGVSAIALACVGLYQIWAATTALLIHDPPGLA